MNSGNRFATPDAVLDYLLTNVRLRDECRIWASCTNSTGTPKIRWRGEYHRAQRLLMQLLHPTAQIGPIAWTTCDDKLCMNARHIQTGTKADHAAYLVSLGRYPKGVRRSYAVAIGRSRRARLGIQHREQVAEMRAAGMTYGQIGKRFGVHSTTVGHFIKRWQHSSTSCAQAAAPGRSPLT